MKQVHSPASMPSEASSRLESGCHTLERTPEISPQSKDGLTILVVVGSCSVQRMIQGQWDHFKVVDGGVLLFASNATTRMIGPTMPEGVALVVSKAVAEAHFGRLCDDIHSGAPAQMSLDPVVISLARVLIAATRDGAGSLVEKNVIDILLTRFGQLAKPRGGADPFERVTLPNWRLRRVIQFIDEQLDKAISLADMAAAAGLSPMHFAAQFKAATGMRPHHYLIARRIQHAKHLLHCTQHTVLNVAVAVGFRTQAHFTTVFKQHESVTPARWRKARLAA